MCLAGLDNSPLYDGAKFVADADTLDSVDVGMTALVAMDARLLSKLSDTLGRGRLCVGACEPLVGTHLGDKREYVERGRGAVGRRHIHCGPMQSMCIRSSRSAPRLSWFPHLRLWYGEKV